MKQILWDWNNIVIGQCVRKKKKQKLIEKKKYHSERAILVYSIENCVQSSTSKSIEFSSCFFFQISFALVFVYLIQHPLECHSKYIENFIFIAECFIICFTRFILSFICCSSSVVKLLFFFCCCLCAFRCRFSYFQMIEWKMNNFLYKKKNANTESHSSYSNSFRNVNRFHLPIEWYSFIVEILSKCCCYHCWLV